MLDKVRATILEHHLLKEQERIVVAVSGGVDSVVLLHCLTKMQEDYQFSLMVAHLNHGFRGEEAAGDAAFVSELARLYNLPSKVESISVPQYMEQSGLSAQEAARVVRYQFLEQVRQGFSGTAIAVGQNANDLAETILINLLRGGASKGLKGIPIKRGHIVRPLLAITRPEIEAYAKQQGLEYRFDSSNAKAIYLRNKIRLQLLPLLEREFNPELVTALNNMAKVLDAEDQLLQQQADEAFQSLVTVGAEGQYILAIKDFQNVHLAIKRRILRLIYQQLQKTFSSTLSFDHIEILLKQISQGLTGSRIALPDNIYMEKSYDQAIFSMGEKRYDKAILSQQTFQLNIPGTTHISQLQIAVKCYFVAKGKEQKLGIPKPNSFSCSLDWESLKEQKLIVRTRRDGDRFKPIGMKGLTKKLKDFFVDEKVPRHLREQIPLIATEAGEIVWIVGYRISEQFKVKATTEKILKLEIEKSF